MQQEVVNRIATFTRGLPLNDEMIGSLRSEFPEIHFTYCLDDDILDASPVKSFDAFNIYLVDGRDHCLKFTSDFDEATGVVVAEVIEDDE